MKHSLPSISFASGGDGVRREGGGGGGSESTNTE